MRMGSWQPKDPPELTPEDIFGILCYLLLLYIVARSGAVVWACLLMIPVFIYIAALIYWDD